MTGQQLPVQKIKERKCCGGFRYPLGVFPESDFAQKQGYLVDFAQENGEEARYVIQVMVSHELARHLFFVFSELLVDPIFPIMDVLSHDPFRKLDTYLASRPVSRSAYLELARKHSDILLEDGFLGFGAMSFHPDIEVFLTEHKVINVFTRNLQYVHDILARWNIIPISKLQFFFNYDHLHVPLYHCRGYSRKEHDYRTVRDLFIENFALHLQETEDDSHSPHTDPGLRTWIVDYSGENTSPARSAFRQTLALNATSQRNALQILTQELRREGITLKTVYEMYRLDPETLEPELRAAGKLRQDGILCRWNSKNHCF